MYICLSCYKFHLSTLQENTSSSINQAALEHDIAKHMETAATKLWRHTHLPSLCSQQCCMLLRSIYRKGPSFFHMHVQCFSLNIASGVSNPSQLYLEVGDSEVQFSFRWLFHQLIMYLHRYMKYECIHKRFGVVLYQWGRDLLQSSEAKVGSVDKGDKHF